MPEQSKYLGRGYAFHAALCYRGKHENFEDALSDFALAYTDQNERDHAALISAIRSGRIEARPTE